MSPTSQSVGARLPWNLTPATPGRIRSRTRPPRRRVAAVAALGAMLAAASYGLGPAVAGASSHREAPLIAADPAVDNTDLYAFVSPERQDYLTFVANWQPFS